jgi:uncharacterized cupin superfamily protein
VSALAELPNVFDDAWEEDPHPVSGWLSNGRMLVPRGHALGMSLYELPPGQTQSPYHFHHGNDELLLVLGGRPTLRTPDGERELQPGDVAHFPRGPAGAHQVWNATDEPARYVIASTKASPEVCEYPDSGKLLAMSLLESQRGERLWSVHRLDDSVDYIDREAPKLLA